VLDKVDDRFELVQRSPRYIHEPPELLRALSGDTFGKIQHHTISSTPPLVREIMLGFWQSLDERTRQRPNAKRVLVGLEISEEHARKVSDPDGGL